MGAGEVNSHFDDHEQGDPVPDRPRLRNDRPTDHRPDNSAALARRSPMERLHARRTHTQNALAGQISALLTDWRQARPVGSLHGVHRGDEWLAAVTVQPCVPNSG